MNYRDFDLKLSGDLPAGCLVEVLASPIQRRSDPVSLRLPPRLTDWQNNLQPGGFEREWAKALGMELFNALFPSPIRSLLDESRALAGVEDVLRLRLDIRTPELSDIPWELIHDGQFHLALQRQSAIVRYLKDHHATNPVREIRSPNILLVVSLPNNAAHLPAIEREVSHIEDSVKDLIAAQKIGRLDILRRTTLPKLQRKLREHPYHVLHYMGHGGVSHDEGFLALEDEGGNTCWIDAERLSYFFRVTPLQLLVLNACQTAVTPQKNAVLGVAQSALAAGIPAVVAMQAKIKDEHAAAFAHEFYLSLAEGCALEWCMAEGRKAIVARSTLDRLDWIIPVLFSSTLDGHVWKLSGPEKQPEEKAPTEHVTPHQRNNHVNLKDSTAGQIIQVQGDGAVIGKEVHQTFYGESSPTDRKRK